MRRPLIPALIGIFLLVLILALGYFLGVAPIRSRIDKTQKDIEATQNKIETEKSTYRQLMDIKNRAPEYEARLAELQAMIPQEPELPGLIRTIQEVADPGSGAGVPWLSFAPGQVSAGGEGYSTYSLSIATAGLYDMLVDFIYRLERLPRAVVIDSIGMSSTTGVLEQTFSPNLGLIQAQITARTFTFAQASGAAPAPAPTPTPKTTPEEEGLPK